jgi:hypothetical protein
VKPVIAMLQQLEAKVKVCAQVLGGGEAGHVRFLTAPPVLGHSLSYKDCPAWSVLSRSTFGALMQLISENKKFEILGKVRCMSLELSYSQPLLHITACLQLLSAIFRWIT